MLVNWRTTSAAIAAAGVILVELSKLFDGDDKTSVNFELLWLNVAIVWGFLGARDAKVTSEQAGAK